MEKWRVRSKVIIVIYVHIYIYQAVIYCYLSGCLSAFVIGHNRLYTKSVICKNLTPVYPGWETECKVVPHYCTHDNNDVRE